MSLLRDGVAVRRKEPRFEGDQQPVHVSQRRQRDPRDADLESGAIDRVELPGRQDCHDAGRQFHVHKLA